MSKSYSTITEKRFYEETGERYLSDGVSIRCQALSRNKTKQLRILRNLPDEPSDTFWPEAQCKNAALPGLFTCRFHTTNPSALVTTSSKEPIAYRNLPYDLAQKVKALADNPTYISRKDEILLLQARIAQLLERLEEGEEGGDTGWALVYSAAEAIQSGNLSGAKDLLLQAIQTSSDERSTWKEIHANMVVLKDLTTTQMKTAKELRSMVTAEQFAHALSSIQQSILFLAKDHIHDDADRRSFLSAFTIELARRFGDSGNFNPS